MPKIFFCGLQFVNNMHNKLRLSQASIKQFQSSKHFGTLCSIRYYGIMAGVLKQNCVNVKADLNAKLYE